MAKVNKKASLLDFMGVIFVLLVAAIIGVSFFIAYVKTNDGLQSIKNSVPQLKNSDAVNVYNSNTTKINYFIDFFVIIMFYGAMLAALISAYLLGNNPVFLIIYVAGALCLLLGAFFLQYSFQNLVADGSLSPFWASLPLTSFHLNFIFFVMIVFSVFLGGALYLKNTSDAGYYG